MNDPFISHEEIKQELKEIEKTVDLLALKLSLLSEKIRYLISKIKSEESLNSAQKYFEILDFIQLSLAHVVFNNDIGVPDRIAKFVHDFDNLEFDKEYYFTKIKNGEYFF